MNAKYITANQLITQCQKVWKHAHDNNYKYGDSHSTPPTADNYISCDRLIAKALWDMGFTDQRQGGEVCSTFDAYFAKHGFVKGSEIKDGSIPLVIGHGGYPHMYIVNTWNRPIGIMTRYDCGSDFAIQTQQPVTTSVNEYTNVIAVYNIEHKESDYSPIYDYDYYIQCNEDVKNAYNGDRAKTLEHFIQYGMKEGRNSHPQFDVYFYKNAYEDLQKAYGDDLKSYYIHYNEYGYKEKRQARGDTTMGTIIADISHWKPVTNWKQAKENCAVLISKATEGTNFVDSTLDSFINGCENNKIPYWLYTYLDNGNELAQTKFMVNLCKPKVGKYFVGYILDVEVNNKEANVQEALKYLESVSSKCMLYTMYAQYDGLKNVIANRGKNTAWWEARYGANNGLDTSKNYPCHNGVDLHQYTSVGKVGGLYNGNAGVDLNKINSTRFDMQWYSTPVSNATSNANANTTPPQAMSEPTTANVRIVHSSIDERGSASGGASGDQTGKEVYVRSFYKHPWNVMLRYTDYNVAKQVATIAQKLANSNLVGYDQGQRNTLYQALKRHNWNVDAYIASGEKTESDCSSFVYACYCCLIPSMRSDSNAPVTSNMRNKFIPFGFTDFSESKYLNEASYLRIGDILLKEGSHVVMVIDNGVNSNVSIESTPQEIYTYTGQSIIEYLNLIGMDSSKAHRAKLAESFGIANYSYTASQNIELLNKMREWLAYYVPNKNYTLQCDMNVRTAPKGTKKTKSQLTADGQKHANSDGSLKKGTGVTCLAMEWCDGQYWMKVPSGYICTIGSGCIYIK